MRPQFSPRASKGWIRRQDIEDASGEYRRALLLLRTVAKELTFLEIPPSLFLAGLGGVLGASWGGLVRS